MVNKQISDVDYKFSKIYKGHKKGSMKHKKKKNCQGCPHRLLFKR